MGTRIENWGRNFGFTPRRVLTPSSAAELARIVRESSTVRVIGAGHSWSQGIVTEDTLVSLDRMKRVLDVDREALRVTVQAGIRLEELVKALEARGLALENLGSIATQSLAGAVSTGTHGTGIGFRCLADQVQGLKLIDGRGEARQLDRGHPDFDAVVVGLGAFGIIYEMTLSVVPTFQMHAITESVPFDEVLADFDGYLRGHDHFKLWWLVPNEEVVVFRQRRTDQPRNDSDFMRWFKDELLAVGVYRTALALQRIAPRRPTTLATNRLMQRSYARRFERICKSHVAFLTPEPPVHREGEWAFDLEDAPALLAAYRDLLEASGHTFSFLQEIRFSAADTFWASPAYGRDSIWLSLYNIDSVARWDDQRRRFEAFARAHGGRPHWGKEALFDREYLSECYPKLADFGALRAEYDPQGRFANRWIKNLFDVDG